MKYWKILVIWSVLIFCISCISVVQAEEPLQVQVTATPASVSAGSSAQILVTVTYYGQPMSGATVVANTNTGSATLTPSSGSTDSSGQASFRLDTTSSTSGTVRVSATVTKQTIDAYYAGNGYVDIPVQPVMLVPLEPVVLVSTTTPIPQPYQPPAAPPYQPPAAPPAVPPYQPYQPPAPQQPLPAGAQAPVAVISVDNYAGNIPLSVTFDGQQSYAPGGSISSYAWNFGDGNTGSGYIAQHQYITPGTFTASLVVTDDSGLLSNSATTQIIVISPVKAPLYTTGGPCDDGNKCTVNDRYDNGGRCVAGQPLNCDDNDTGTVDSCNPSTGCIQTRTVLVQPKVTQAGTGTVQGTGAAGQVAAKNSGNQNVPANLPAEHNTVLQKYDYYLILDLYRPEVFNMGTIPESSRQAVPQTNDLSGGISSSTNGYGGNGGQQKNPFTSQGAGGSNANLNPMEGNPNSRMPGIQNDLTTNMLGSYPGVVGSVERYYGPFVPGKGLGATGSVSNSEGDTGSTQQTGTPSNLQSDQNAKQQSNQPSDQPGNSGTFTPNTGNEQSIDPNQPSIYLTDPFYDGRDALGVPEQDGSSTLRGYTSPESGTESDTESGMAHHNEASYALIKVLMNAPPGKEREGFAPWVNPKSSVSRPEGSIVVFTQSGTGQSAQRGKSLGFMITTHGYFPQGWVPVQRINLVDPNPWKEKSSAGTGDVYVPGLLLPDPVPLF